MEEKEQPLSKDILFRIMKTAEILAKSADFHPQLAKQPFMQNNHASKVNHGSSSWNKKTRS